MKLDDCKHDAVLSQLVKQSSPANFMTSVHPNTRVNQDETEQRQAVAPHIRLARAYRLVVGRQR